MAEMWHDEQRKLGTHYTTSDHNCRINFMITEGPTEDTYFVRVENTTTRELGGFTTLKSNGLGQTFIRVAVHKYLTACRDRGWAITREA